MTSEDLLPVLEKIAKIPSDSWMDTLNERKKKELDFHNRDRDRRQSAEIDQDTYDKFYGNKKYYRTVKGSKAYVDAWIRNNAKGKIFLDYACGNGENAIKAARFGADLAIGFDISDVSVKNAQADVQAAGVEKTFFFQADAENTKLPDCCIDIIVCSGMLHHLDLSYAFPELRRILAPGGRILAVEALDYNPAIKLYRMLTPAMRTEWEKSHILSLKDIRFARYFFDIGSVRYWHIMGYLGAHLSMIQPLLNGLDWILTKLPGIRLMSWIFTFELLNKDRR